MVGDIRHNIGRHAVRAHQHKILITAEIGSLKPQRVLGYIGVTAVFKQLYNALSLAVCVQTAFLKPGVVMYAVFCKVVLEPLNILRQSEIHQRFAAFLLRFFHKAVAVYFGKCLCVVYYILAVV